MSETTLRSDAPRLDSLVPRIRDFLAADVVEYTMLGKRLRGFRSPDSPSIWLRDHSDIVRAGRYWEKELNGAIDHFAETQSAQGWLFDNFGTLPEKPPAERENWARYIRVPVEADVEFRFVKAVYLTWQATGDDRWLRRMMPHMEKGLAYSVSDPWRWDRKTRLVKRALTIDTWDFDYTAGRHHWLNFQIDDQTFWGIMHGDNSGTYEAFLLMARCHEVLKNRKRARYWLDEAAALRTRANRVCFNGRFYTHHVPLTPRTVPGVDETAQLSLSNPMGINRGMSTHAIAVSIIREYESRGRTTGAFAPWFSIDPPFPAGAFGEAKLVPGAYCNGGIMPLVGGELARAAFEHGFEEYGVKQLLKYEELTRNNETYLWYFPDGRPSTVETSTSPEASPTDGWGSSAMLWALMEGLAGVVDRGSLLREISLAPRWPAAGSRNAEVTVGYAASGAAVSYTYEHDPSTRQIAMTITGPAVVHLHLLLPEGGLPSKVTANGKSVRFRTIRVEQSRYADAEIRMKGRAEVVVSY
ncbi:MAG: hypothetical protein AB1428_08385 [Bacteroidota bacterium]